MASEFAGFRAGKGVPELDLSRVFERGEVDLMCFCSVFTMTMSAVCPSFSITNALTTMPRSELVCPMTPHTTSSGYSSNALLRLGLTTL